MARKGSQPKNGLDQRSPSHNKGAAKPGPTPLTTKDRGDVNDEEVGLVKEIPSGMDSVSSTKRTNDMDHVQDGKNSKKKSRKSHKKERRVMDETVTGHAGSCSDDTEVDKTGISTAEAPNISDESDLSHNHNLDNTNGSGNSSSSLHGEEGLEGVEFPEALVFKFIRTAALSVERLSADFVERHQPTFAILKSNMLKAYDHVQMNIQHAQPIIFRWIKHIGNIMLLLFMVWLDCTLRGIDSFLRMGTTSFFAIVWFSVLSVIAMVGISKFLLTLVCHFPPCKFI